MKLSYYLKKRIVDYMIHCVMLVILFFTLFPIGWMVFTSLKENTDVLIGKIPFSHAHNNTIQVQPDKDSLWVLTSDGGVGKFDRKSFKEKLHAKASTSATHYIVDDKYVWVSSANRGLLRFDKENLKSKKEYDLKLPSYDRSKVATTTITSYKGNIYFTLQQKYFESVVEFNIKDEKVSRYINISNEKSPVLIKALYCSGENMFVAMDKGLLRVDLPTGKVVDNFALDEYLPLGVERIKGYGNNLVIAGNTGAYIFNPAEKKVTKSIFATSVSGLNIFGDMAYIGTNRGFIAYDLKSGKETLVDNIFRQVKADGTVMEDSEFAPAETVSFAKEGDLIYLGSSYGRVSAYNLKLQKTVQTTSARQGAIVISWINYVDMWKNVDFGLYLKNSFFICGVATVFAMIFATMAAYALARFNFPGAKLLSMAILATQMVPGMMFLIPIYSNFVKFTEMTGIPIKGTYWGIIFVYSAFFIPFSIWILRGFFAAIPVELEEAAKIDGCSPYQVFWHVVLPLAIPGIIATGIYVFLTAWDELVFAWVLTSGDTMTIPVGIRNFVGNYQNRFDLIMAAATVATAPVMLLFFLLQKHIVKGLTAGAVKG